MESNDHRAVDVDRVTRVRHQHDIALVERGHAEVRNAFLGADGDDGLGGRVELNAIALRVPVGDGLAQAGNAFRKRVAMRLRPLGGFNHLINDVLRCRPIGVTHAEVDDIFAAASRGCLQFAGDVEDVRGQAFEARELVQLLSPILVSGSVLLEGYDRHRA